MLLIIISNFNRFSGTSNFSDNSVYLKFAEKKNHQKLMSLQKSLADTKYLLFLIVLKILSISFALFLFSFNKVF